MTHIVLSTILFFLNVSYALTPADLRKQIENVEKDFPAEAHVFSIGENDDREPIYALRISTNPTKSDPSKIGYFIVGGHHGNEPHSVSLAIHFARTLAFQLSRPRLLYGKNGFSDLTHTEWWIVPAVNLPGLQTNSRWENGRDPNREYPSPCKTFTAKRLQSVDKILNTLTQRPFSAMATLHGYIGTLTCPWGVTTPTPQSADYPLYEKWLRSASRLNGYRWGTSAEVIYPANGTFEDYVYWQHGAWSLLVELKNGSATDLVSTTDAMLKFFSQVDASRVWTPTTTVNCYHAAGPDLYLE